MPTKKKGPSLAKVARTYKKAYTKPKTTNEGARFFNDGAKPYAIGDTERKLKYKPAPRAGTFGTDSMGAPGTKRVKKNKI
jgi:hypothetical protein